MPDSCLKKVLVTGGAGFIGSTLVNRLLLNPLYEVFNIDKLTYSSNLISINQQLMKLGELSSNRYHFYKVDLFDQDEIEEIIYQISPDLIFNLAAETHVDRSIDKPIDFINSNIIGTYNLLHSSYKYWSSLTNDLQEKFRFIHISTDEVFGSLSDSGHFNELTPYSPRSPYSASKASSDHLVRAWNHTYNFPSIVTNCSNNFGPWQFPEKFIPVVIIKATSGSSIPIYGAGLNIRDWLYVEDHIDALLLVSETGIIGETYCIGGSSEITNNELVMKICKILDNLKPQKYPYSNLITHVKDRPGHDYRYSIDSSKISNDLGWKKKYQFDVALTNTIEWYINNLEWCEMIMKRSGFKGERLGSNSK